MAAYFIISAQIDNKQERKPYDEYIAKVKPIVESFGGQYILRSEKITHMNTHWLPNRLIIIKFPSKEQISNCFSSEEYKTIENLRTKTIIANAIIVEE
jgi:uncharacterized protein (DUF1330 family)